MKRKNKSKNNSEKKKVVDEIVIKPNLGLINFKGCSHFRQRIICSTLSGKPIRISDIRAKSEEPGIKGKN